MPTQLTIQQLELQHKFVTQHQPLWSFYNWAYQGTKSLIQHGNIMPKHERETQSNYQNRLKNAYGFNYSKAVVDLLSFYLFQQPALHDWGALKDDRKFLNMLKDCDYYATDFDEFLIEGQKAASIRGHAGVLVDKPYTQISPTEQSVSDQDDTVYPYFATYTAENILDWSYTKDSQGRPTLAYVKLREFTDSSITEPEDRSYDPSLSPLDFVQYRIWTRDYWQVYDVENRRIVNFREGPNPLNEVPFVWLLNVKTDKRNIGLSDLEEIANIDASIIRNLSQVEEITDYAAFPMLRKPRLLPGNEEDDTVGVTSIVEFDPNFPNAMPDWLAAEVKEPVEAIMSLVYRKVEEIYRSVNAGGLNSTEVTRQVKSGVALQQEFRLLNAKLAARSVLLEEAERKMLYFWTLWEGKPEAFTTLSIQRPRDFNISDLLNELETVVLGTSIVKSPTFDETMQKQVVRKMLPDTEDYSTIDKEIEAAPESTLTINPAIQQPTSQQPTNQQSIPNNP